MSYFFLGKRGMTHPNGGKRGCLLCGGEESQRFAFHTRLQERWTALQRAMGAVDMLPLDYVLCPVCAEIPEFTRQERAEVAVLAQVAEWGLYGPFVLPNGRERAQERNH